MTEAAVERTGPFAHFARDFTASIVVFLVAMPLCMGIAICLLYTSDAADERIV